MAQYFTTGQVARKLRVSVSTLKRWLSEPHLKIPEKRNYNGWRLFTDFDVERLKEHKKRIRRKGKRFNDTTLIPTVKFSNGVQFPSDGSEM